MRIEIKLIAKLITLTAVFVVALLTGHEVMAYAALACLLVFVTVG